MTMPKIYVRRKYGKHIVGGSLVVTTKWQGIDASRFPDVLRHDRAIEIETEAEHKGGSARRKKGADAEEATEEATAEPTEEGSS